VENLHGLASVFTAGVLATGRTAEDAGEVEQQSRVIGRPLEGLVGVPDRLQVLIERDVGETSPDEGLDAR